MIRSEGEAKDWLRALPVCDAAAMDRLETLVDLLRAENARQNLVSAASLAEVWRRHVADSAQLLRFVPRETSGPWLDLGTGAGFPGLVISALLPACEVVMVESRPKRSAWLDLARSELGLTRSTVAAGKLEALETCSCYVISARAFAPLQKLIGLSARFSTSDTLWLLPKGRSARDELAALTSANHLFHVEQSLTDPEAGIIVGTVPGKGQKP